MRPIPTLVQFVGTFLVALSVIQIFFGLGAMPSQWARNPEMFHALKWIAISIFAAQFAVGFNILAGRNWARYTWLVVASINLFIHLLQTSSLFGFYLSALFFAFVVYCLFFDKQADAFFKAPKRPVLPPQ